MSFCLILFLYSRKVFKSISCSLFEMRLFCLWLYVCLLMLFWLLLLLMLLLLLCAVRILFRRCFNLRWFLLRDIVIILLLYDLRFGIMYVFLVFTMYNKSTNTKQVLFLYIILFYYYFNQVQNSYKYKQCLLWFICWSVILLNIIFSVVSFTLWKSTNFMFHSIFSQFEPSFKKICVLPFFVFFGFFNQ